MADDPVVAERGVLTAPAQAWDLAARQTEVIRQLAGQRVVGLAAADTAAIELGVSRRQVYVLVRRWRAGEGLVSDLLPGTSSGGRGGGRLPDDVEAVVREILRTRYLTRQRRTVASICREITRECRTRGLRVPSRGTILCRIAQLDPVKVTSVREGRDAARTLKPAGGVPPEITGLLEQVQADHTPVDVIVVDERHRLPAGRPYLTVAIDVASRCVVGMVVTLEAPSATSVGLCLAHAAADKRPWLERLGAEAVWPMSGKPFELHVDNAAEFRSEALRRGCEQHGIRLRYRPPGQPHFGGIVERLIGTMMQMIHELPGTTFSSTADRGGYDSIARAVLTLRELQLWLALAVACYHAEVHESLGRTPAAVWAEKAAETGTPPTVASETAFLVDFLPVIRRTLTRSGFVIDHVQYYCDALSRGSRAVSSWAGSSCAAIPATSAASGHSTPTAVSTSRCRTGRWRVPRSARGSRRPPSTACASSAALMSTRPRCSRWWTRCARSPTPPRPQPARPAVTGNGAWPSRHAQSRRRRSRPDTTALRRRRGRSR